MSRIRRVLFIYTDPYYLVKQVYPYGLDMLAARLREDGVATRIEYAFLPAADPAANLAAAVADFTPDLIGLGIRNIDTCMACEDYGDLEGEGFRSFFFLPRIRQVADAVRKLLPGVPMICGGGGFTMAPREMLAYLDVGFGIQGEGEEPLSAFVRAWPDRERLATIPGLVSLNGDDFAATPREEFIFPRLHGPERDPGFRHALQSAGLPVRVKRGCNQGCSFCVEPIIEGRRFVHRDVQEVVDELWAAADMDQVNKVFFVDTEFNVPDLEYATALVTRILDENLPTRFRFVSQFLPRPFTGDFAEMLARAGFSIILTCTSFADEVLEAAGVSYRAADIAGTLELCAVHAIDTTVDLIFGLPGETWETVARTIKSMNDLPPTPLRRYEYTVGGRIYPGTALARRAAVEGPANVYGSMTIELLEPCFYCTPAPPLELKHHVDERVPDPMRFDNELSESSRARLAVVYLADRGRFDEACAAFLALPLPDKSAAFDYFFRTAANAGYVEAARSAAEDLRAAMVASNNPAYLSQAGVINYYLAVLNNSGM